jgi:hypothetical protein
MTRPQAVKNLLCFVLGLLLAAIPASAQDAASQINSEINRLEQSLKNRPVSLSDAPEIGNMIGNALKDARNAASAGRLYLALETLGRAEDLLQGARAIEDKTEAVKSGLPAFETEWNKASLELTAFEQKSHDRDWGQASTALRALSEAAQGKSIPLLEGSRGFATATGPKDGLLYLGQAQGEAQFAQFVFSLAAKSPRKSAPFPLRSLLPEIQRLQERTNAAFQPPRSIDLHPRFIALNATLKLAGELDASRSYAGALYEYLEATRHYGMLEAAEPDAAKQSQVKQAIVAARTQLEQSRRDDSVAQIFLERAQSYIEHADGSAPSADEWRSAQVILEQVLPAYFAAAKPAVPLQKARGMTTTVTLVRWPYT